MPPRISEFRVEYDFARFEDDRPDLPPAPQSPAPDDQQDICPVCEGTDITFSRESAYPADAPPSWRGFCHVCGHVMHGLPKART